jgi:hypothetical protein
MVHTEASHGICIEYRSMVGRVYEPRTQLHCVLKMSAEYTEVTGVPNCSIRVNRCSPSSLNWQAELQSLLPEGERSTACIVFRLVGKETLTLSVRSQSNGRELVGYKLQTTPGQENTRKRQPFYFILCTPPPLRTSWTLPCSAAMCKGVLPRTPSTSCTPPPPPAVAPPAQRAPPLLPGGGP